MSATPFLQLELQQLSLMARDLTPLIPNAKLLEELQALG